MEWVNKFWKNHGTRLAFAGLALAIAVAMRFLELQAESNTIIIGLAMLFFNKARGTNGKGETDEKV